MEFEATVTASDQEAVNRMPVCPMRILVVELGAEELGVGEHGGLAGKLDHRWRPTPSCRRGDFVSGNLGNLGIHARGLPLRNLRPVRAAKPYVFDVKVEDSSVSPHHGGPLWFVVRFGLEVSSLGS